MIPKLVEQNKKAYQPTGPGADCTTACVSFCNFVKKQVSALQSEMTLFGPPFMVLLCRTLLRGIVAHLKQMQVTDTGAIILKRDASLYRGLAASLLGGATPSSREGAIVLSQYDTLCELVSVFMGPLTSITSITQMGNLRFVGPNELQQWVRMRVDWKQFKLQL